MGLFGLLGLRGPTAVHVKFLFYQLRLQPTSRKTVTFTEIFARNMPNIPIYCIHLTVPWSFSYYTTFWETSIKRSTTIKRSVGLFPRVTAWQRFGCTCTQSCTRSPIYNSILSNITSLNYVCTTADNGCLNRNLTRNMMLSKKWIIPISKEIEIKIEMLRISI